MDEIHVPREVQSVLHDGNDIIVPSSYGDYTLSLNAFEYIKNGGRILRVEPFGHTIDLYYNPNLGRLVEVEG